MPQRPGFDNTCDLLRKLHREADRIRREVAPDNVFSFAVTALAIRDWIKKDPGIAPKTRAQLPNLTSSPWWRICQDVANGTKHFTITRYTPLVDDATAEQGYGRGRYGAGAFGVGESAIAVTLTDGTRHNALDVIENTVRVCDELLSAECRDQAE